MDIIDTEKRLNDAIKNGTEADVNYWRGYRDAVKAMLKEEPNEPLTMDELREMHGNPVWIYRLEDKRGWWAVVRINDTRLYTDYGAWCDLREYGKTWLAYRRPPKEGTR